METVNCTSDSSRRMQRFIAPITEKSLFSNKQSLILEKDFVLSVNSPA